jgi:DNA-binding helix-hairpin-helix protein with protein kinase domain
VNFNAVMTSSGRRLQLGNVLGKGGEANIFHVEGDSTIAVKIYTDGKGLERQAKVTAMIADRLRERTPIVAFPVETVSVNGAFVGFTMRKAIGAKVMHQLCSPGDRKAEFPDANFRFLVRVALNFTRAVATINNLGAVIGDINESGALVDQRALVTVIDSDSFQYRSRGQTFRCRVGKPEYTPPELRGQSLENVDRTINHDAFGLAVIIFEILFMGRHPFSGIYRGAGEQPTIAKAIAEGRFAYSPQQSQTKMEPPPHVPRLVDIPMELATAFLRAFGSPASGVPTRPTATEWIPLLERMEKGIIECKANSAHYYSAAARTCPWCRFEAATGSVLFISHQAISRGTFDLDYIMSKIERIASPGQAPDLLSLMPATGNLKPSQAARNFKRRVWARKALGLAAAGLALFLMVNGMAWGFFVLIPAGVLFFGEVSGASQFRQQRSSADAIWKRSIESWNRDAGCGRFDEKKSELLRATTAYRALPSVEREMLMALENKKRDLQMQKHLEAYKISRARIDGVGDGRKMTLRSFGVETAWDIKTNVIQAVPGFGPVLTGKLTAWRRSVEGRFSFNPNAPTDPKDVARVHAEIAMRRSTMETAFINGIRELETMRTEALTKRNYAKQHEAAYMAFRRAEIDNALL